MIKTRISIKIIAACLITASAAHAQTMLEEKTCVQYSAQKSNALDIVKDHLNADSDAEDFDIVEINLEASGDTTTEFMAVGNSTMWCGSGGCSFRLYVVQDQNIRLLGDIFTSKLEILETSQNGYKDLYSYRRYGENPLRYDGNTYKADDDAR